MRINFKAFIFLRQHVIWLDFSVFFGILKEINFKANKTLKINKIERFKINKIESRELTLLLYANKALNVFFPAILSTESPWSFWNCFTALAVPEPKIPSTPLVL